MPSWSTSAGGVPCHIATQPPTSAGESMIAPVPSFTSATTRASIASRSGWVAPAFSRTHAAASPGSQMVVAKCDSSTLNRIERSVTN